MRRPTTNGQKTKAQAQKEIDTFKGVVKGVKNYSKNVAGGAKIIGSAVKSKVLKAFKK